MVQITNGPEVEAALKKQAGILLGQAIDQAIEDIVDELPKQKNSSIANELVKKTVSDTEYEVYASYVWTLLNDGTGVYSDKHRGKGPHGEIVPVNAKKLHFRNALLAAALGFRDENIFLSKIKGINPRFYWDRHFSSERITEIMNEINR